MLQSRLPSLTFIAISVLEVPFRGGGGLTPFWGEGGGLRLRPTMEAAAYAS